MKVKSFEKPENKAAELTVEINAEELDAAIEQAYNKNKGDINVAGFRRGHAPRKMIEKMYGSSVFHEDAIEILYPQAFDFAYDEVKFDLVGQPGIKDVQINDGVGAEITFQLWLYPTVTIEGYKGISAVKPSVRILKKDIDDEIDRIAERNAREQAVERESKSGDIVNINFKGLLEGKPFDGGTAEKYDLRLGSGQFVPGFEDQLIGVKAGDEKNVNIKFPEQYTEDLAGKDVVFEVKVNEVKERVKPAIDDEFAKDVSEFDTLDEYKNSVKEKLTEERKAAANDQFEGEVLDKVAELVKGFIPDVMVDERIEGVINNYEYRLREQGMDLTTYLNMLGMTLDQFANELRPNATRDVKLDLAFEQIAKLENIEVTDKELSEEFDRLSKLYNTEADKLKESIGEESARNQIKLRKAHDVVIASAVVEKKSAKKDEKKGDEAEKAAE